MAAPTLVQVLGGIQARVATIPGLRGRTDVFLPDEINPPQAVVPIPHITAYHAAFHKGKMTIAAQVIVITSAAYDRIGQTALTTYMDAVGANSIELAIEADRTLGGVVDDCIVLDSQEGIQTVGAFSGYGATFNLQIIANGV